MMACDSSNRDKLTAVHWFFFSTLSKEGSKLANKQTKQMRNHLWREPRTSVSSRDRYVCMYIDVDR